MANYLELSQFNSIQFNYIFAHLKHYRYKKIQHKIVNIINILRNEFLHAKNRYFQAVLKLKTILQQKFAKYLHM